MFTINNPEAAPNLEGHEYVYQKEVGASGTPHYQGYIKFPNNKRLKAVREIVPGAHLEVRRGTHLEAVAYCTKEETRVEGPWSTMSPHVPGKRNDLEEFRQGILGKRTYGECINDPELSHMVAKFPLYTREVLSHRLPERIEAELRPWQQELLTNLLEPPNPRTIYWVHENIGNVGKTFMADFLYCNYQAQRFNNGKSGDIAYAIESPSIVVFDFSRSQEEHINYGIIEDVKNGYVFSAKYQSAGKRFPSPHVVVFANFPPLDGKLSSDRLVEINLNKKRPLILNGTVMQNY